MLSIDLGTARFNYRVAGIAIEGDRVLLHRAGQEPFWSLPGGRPEIREPSVTALRREMSEELGVEAEIGRLVWVAESFFVYDDRPWHEIALYFLMRLAFIEDTGRSFQRVDEKGVVLYFQWFPLDALPGLPIYPRFLNEGLASLPTETVHVIDHEGDVLYSQP